MTDEAPCKEDQETPSKSLPPLSRKTFLERVGEDVLWDVVIIGGGATGAGIAVDAASRGLSTLLIDAQDWSAGTSSRSTKLIHGGVRYMKNPRDWRLVAEALQERRILIQNAPHLVHATPFVLPCFQKWERELYTIGLGVYAAMAGSATLGRTRSLNAAETAARLQGVKTGGLLGGVEFFDAQFDDARLNVALVRTAVQEGAIALNYMAVTALERSGGMIQSVTAKDTLTDNEYRIRARMVFNCAGVWADKIRRMVEPETRRLLRCSRGTHIVLDREFLPSEAGMLIPKTRDGRVLFCIPWHGMTLVGTTDIEEREPSFDPQPSEEEIAFLLETASGYLAKPVTRADVRAAFTGLRPLLGGAEGVSGSTAQASREHAVICEFGNMITVAGGKWTSYRRMAEDALLEATLRHLVEPRLCVTKTLPIAQDTTFDPEVIESAAVAGPAGDADVVAYALYCRDNEGAVTAEDVLYRRLRIGQMDARRAETLLPIVAAAMAGEPYELEPVPEPIEVAEPVESVGVSEAKPTEDSLGEATPMTAHEDVVAAVAAAATAVTTEVLAHEATVAKSATVEPVAPVEPSSIEGIAEEVSAEDLTPVEEENTEPLSKDETTEVAPQAPTEDALEAIKPEVLPVNEVSMDGAEETTEVKLFESGEAVDAPASDDVLAKEAIARQESVESTAPIEPMKTAEVTLSTSTEDVLDPSVMERAVEAAVAKAFAEMPDDLTTSSSEDEGKK